MVTSEEIAKICGVTRSTVDRALNNRAGINPKTKEKILKAAKELGYTPNFIASSLSKGITYTIGVVVLDLYNQFFSNLLNCIELEARKLGYYIQIAMSHKNKEYESSVLQHFIDRKVDGIILYSVQNNSPVFSNVKEAGIPMVSIVNRIEEKCSFIGINDREAMLSSVKVLYEAGHRKIGYISYPLETGGIINQYALTQRYLGFMEALEAINLSSDERYIIVSSTLDEGLQRILNHYKSDTVNRPSAFICMDDLYAIKTIDFLKKNGLGVPENISITGFDNIQASNFITPPLTTVEYPVELMAEKAVSYIVNASLQHKSRNVNHINDCNMDLIDLILPTKMILRQSVKNVT